MKGKGILFLGVCAGLAILGLSFYFLGYIETWRLWNIPASPLPFLDLRSILSAAEAYAAGYDPTLANPFDPGGRAFNYPPLVWRPILASGVTQAWAIPLGIMLVGLFVIGIIIFPGKLNGLSIFLLLLALFSPATLLGVERGNVDLLFFFLMSMGLVLVEMAPGLSLSTLITGVLFKIFPVFGIGYFLSEDRRKSVKFVAAGILVALIYFLSTYHDLAAVFKNTPKGADISYGVLVLPEYIAWLIRKETIQRHHPFLYHLALRLNGVYSRLPLLPYALALTAVVVLSGLGLLHRGKVRSSDSRNGRAFWLGAGIYIGTFLLGNNWDYRLMFLLFTLPQLAEWITGGHGRSRAAAWISVAALFLSMWYFVLKAGVEKYLPAGSYVHPILDELINWILFAGMVYLYAFSLPEWVVDGGRAFLQRAGRIFKTHISRQLKSRRLSLSAGAPSALEPTSRHPSGHARRIIGRGREEAADGRGEKTGELIACDM